jgi:hypothetical protein
MDPKNDISIGKDNRIKWIELDTNENSEFDVDDFFEMTEPFWENLETLCVAECCGIHAFDLWPESIKSASKNLNSMELKNKLLKLRSDVVKANKKIIVSKRLNNLFDARVFINLVDHIVSNL